MSEFDETADETVDLGVDLDGVPEQHAVKPGEYMLTLVSCAKKLSKKGNEMIIALLETTDDPDSKLINHIMMLPAEGDKQRTVNARLRSIADFYEAFNIPKRGPVNYDEYIGNTAWAILSETEDEEYGAQNRVKRFVTGK